MKITHKATCRSFELTQQNRRLARVVFPKWYSFQAEVRTPAGEFKFKPDNFWKTRFQITFNGKDKGQIKLDWKGKASIRWYSEGPTSPDIYTFVRRGLFQFYYELMDSYGTVIAVLDHSFNWKNFSTEATVSFHRQLPAEQQLELLFCCGYIMSVVKSKQAAS